MRKMVWVKGNPKPVKLSEYDKEKLKTRIKVEVEKYPDLQNRISRMEIKAGRIYLYELHEVKPLLPQAQYTLPLIDGKYFEFIIARITVCISSCSLDFQCDNNRWMTVDRGTLEECIEKITSSGWFDRLL